MADAVNGTCLPNSQSGADVRSDAEADRVIEAAFLRFENNRKSAQSAAAIFENSGRALIDQIKTIKTNSATPRRDEMASRLRAAARSLDGIRKLVHCAQCASRAVEEGADCEGVSAVLDQVWMEMNELSKGLMVQAEG